MTTVFPGCRTALGSPRLRSVEGKVDQAIAFIESWFEANLLYGARLGFKTVATAIGYDASNFRRRVREHPTFRCHLTDLGLSEDRTFELYGFTVVVMSIISVS